MQKKKKKKKKKKKNEIWDGNLCKIFYSLSFIGIQ